MWSENKKLRKEILGELVCHISRLGFFCFYIIIRAYSKDMAVSVMDAFCLTEK